MKQNAGFTLMELLVVIAIIGLLGTIALVNLNSARDKARIARGKSFESQLEFALRLDLAGEWLFDDGTARDTSSYKNDGALMGNAAIQSNCIDNQCVYLDGNGDYIRVDHVDKALTETQQITVQAWIKAESHGGVNRYILEHELNNGSDYLSYLAWLSNERYRNAMILHNGGVETLSVSDSISLNKWHHVAAIFDGNKQALYLDGELLSEQIVNNPISLDTASLTFIGSRGSAQTWHGWIDNVRIYYAAPEL